MITLSRPARILSDEDRLGEEYRNARWIYHRLLDFEAEHQKILDAAADEIAPGIVRTGRILAQLARRVKRVEHTPEGRWAPDPKPELAAKLKIRLEEARKIRNADPRWKEALKWADEEVGEPKAVRRRRAKPAAKVKRRKGETDEAWEKRFTLLTTDESDEHYAAKVAKAPRRSRREKYRTELYNSPERRIYWGTWNALCKSVDQARRDVISLRAKGMPAEIRRPKFRHPTSLAMDPVGIRILSRGEPWSAAEVRVDDRVVDCFPSEKLQGHKLPPGAAINLVKRTSPWWTIELRIGLEDEWVRLKAECNNWHEIPEGKKPTTAKLTRRIDGERWSYSLSLTFDIEKSKSKNFVPTKSGGTVAFDWGHREHGHDRWREGIRAFAWIGDDGQVGEVLIPNACRKALDEIDELKGRMDEMFDRRKAALKLPHKMNRWGYRRMLMRSGVKTEEETAWLRWEMRYERRVEQRRKRFQNLRKELYIGVVRELRQRYSTFAFEAENVKQIQQVQIKEERKRRQRANRDLTARYEFVSICKRFGTVVEVSAHNSTRECPEKNCDGLLEVNGPELIVVCPKCGRARDKDYGARQVILDRAKKRKVA